MNRVTYAEAQTFVEAVGRPRKRRLSARKPWQPVGLSPLWVTCNVATGRSLVRGKLVGRLMEYADVVEVADWSVSACGFVLPTDALADVVAAAQHLRSPIRFRDIEADGTVTQWRRWTGRASEASGTSDATVRDVGGDPGQGLLW